MLKVTLGADLGYDNGIFKWGEFDNLTDAIASVLECSTCEFYGAEIKSGEQLIAFSYGTWKSDLYPKEEFQKHLYWQCPMPAKGWTYKGNRILHVYEGNFDGNLFQGHADILTPEGEYKSAECDWWQSDDGSLLVDYLKDV